MTNIINETVKYNIIFDKTTQTFDSLPYEIDSILIQPNEFAKHSVINRKLSYLHNNFLFLYKLCNYGEFTVPTSKNFSYSGSNIAFYEEVLKNYKITDNTNLTNSIYGALSYFKFQKEGTVLFYADKTHIYSIICDPYKLEPLTKTSFVDPLSGSIVFSDITQIKTSKSGALYVVDNGYKNLYFYNINPVLEGENIYRSLPFLKNAIGGEGIAEEKSKFGNINNIGINEKFVVAEDNKNKCFKLFDKNLNWLDTTKFISVFNRIEKFDAITINSSDHIYCIAKRRLFVFAIESNFNIILVDEFDISTYVGFEEKVLNIKFSYTDVNVFYVFTNIGIKKVWASSPTGCMGAFMPQGDIVWADTFIGNGDTSDSIILKTTTPGNIDTFRLQNYSDVVKINSILANRDFEIYGYENIKINKNEYVSNWVFQKAFKKIFYNHNKLIKETKFRLVEDDTDLSIVIDKVYNQIFLNFTRPSNEPVNLNIGINEIFQAEVINRVINEIYNLQITLLYYVVNNLTTKKYFSPAPYKIRRGGLTYTYFADDSINLFPEPAKLTILEELAPLDGIVLSLGGAPYIGGEGISIIPGTDA